MNTIYLPILLIASFPLSRQSVFIQTKFVELQLRARHHSAGPDREQKNERHVGQRAGRGADAAQAGRLQRDEVVLHVHQSIGSAVLRGSLSEKIKNFGQTKRFN